MKKPSQVAIHAAGRALPFCKDNFVVHEVARAMEQFADECVAEDRARTLILIELACGPDSTATHAQTLRKFADIWKLAWKGKS